MRLILEGLLGAGLLSVTLVYLLNVLRERRSRKRELKGLLQLIQVEIVHNHFMLKHFWKGWGFHFLLNPAITPMSMEAWKDSRVRLAQMLSLQQFSEIANYYQNVQWLLDIAYAENSDEYSDDDRREVLKTRGTKRDSPADKRGLRRSQERHR